MKRIVACVVSILICSMLAISAYASTAINSQLDNKDIDVNGIYVSDFENVSIGKVNGEDTSVGDKKINISSEFESNRWRYAVNKIFAADEAYTYVKEKTCLDSFDAYYVNFIDDDDGKLDSTVKIQISDYSNLTKSQVFFIDSEGNNISLAADIEDGILSINIDCNGFIVIELPKGNDSLDDSSDTSDPNDSDNSSSSDDSSMVDDSSLDSDSSSNCSSSSNSSSSSANTSYENNSNNNSENQNSRNSNGESNNGGSTESPNTGVAVGISAGSLLLGALLIVFGKSRNNNQ